MAIKVVSSSEVKNLSPVALLKQLGHSHAYDKPYKLYRTGERFYIIALCERYFDGCSRYLEFEEKDLKDTSCGGYGGFDYYGKKYVCPRCGAENWIDTGVFPALLSIVREKEFISSNQPLMTIEKARDIRNQKVRKISQDEEMSDLLKIILKDQGLDSSSFNIVNCRNNKIRLVVSNKGLISKIPKLFGDYEIEVGCE